MELDLFRQWVEEPECRRRLLKLTYDEEISGVRCSGDDIPCDLCSERAKALDRQASEASTAKTQQAIRLTALRTFLRHWKGVCFGCLIKQLSEQISKSYAIYIRPLLIYL